MSREVHVRFSESARVKFPRATQLNNFFLEKYWLLRQNILQNYSPNIYLTPYDLCCLLFFLKDKSHRACIKFMGMWKQYGDLLDLVEEVPVVGRPFRIVTFLHD